MRMFYGLAAIVLVLPLAAGCDAVGGILTSTTVTVELVNNGDYNVEATLFYYDDQDIAEALLTKIGTQLEYTIEPGETVTFTRDCDDLQAIIVEDAELQAPLLKPDDDSPVQRDGDVFGCGDRIVFTFVHSDVLVDFEVRVSYERGE